MFKTGEGSLSFSYKSSKVRVENQIKVKMVAESPIEFSVELPSLLALLKAFPLVSNKLVFYIYKPKVEIQCLADNEYTHNFILSRVM